MPLPSGVTGATLVAKVTKVTSSSPVAVSVSIEPSVDLTHTASGTKLSAMIETLVSGSGQASKILVPYSAQAGFVDSTGAAVSRWYYTATVSYTTASGARAYAPQSKTFILPVGSGGDLENLPAYSPPAKTSTVELPDRLSVEALNATYAIASPVLTVTYNGDGSVASTVENGVTTTFTYNTDGTVATQTRAGTTKTFTYDASGNVTGAA